MRYVLGLTGLALALVAWAAVFQLSGSGLPYLDKEAGAVVSWLLYSPAVLCLLPWAALRLPRDAVAAIWLIAIAPVAGVLNFFAAAYLGSAAPESRLVVWVLSILWAAPITVMAFRLWRRRSPSRSGRYLE